MTSSHTHNHKDNAIENTERIEMFSDGVYAIVATLLVLDLKVPEMIGTVGSMDFIHALVNLGPEIIAFALSFFIIAVFWVNHHHFFHTIERTDWRLMWYNNFHLFCLATIPFATAFIGKYPFSLVPVLIYAFSLFLSALSMRLMFGYVFGCSNLLYPEFAGKKNKKERTKRTALGMYLYIAAALFAFLSVYISLLLFLVIPFLFMVPQLLSNDVAEA